MEANGQFKNKGYKKVLVVVDVFSRFAWAIPMENKTIETTVNALEGIVRESGRRPSEVDTDGGLEFGPKFTSLLEGKKIAHKKRPPSQPNGLAVVDAVIKRLKKTLVKDLADQVLEMYKEPVACTTGVCVVWCVSGRGV